MIQLKHKNELSEFLIKQLEIFGIELAESTLLEWFAEFEEEVENDLK